MLLPLLVVLGGGRGGSSRVAQSVDRTRPWRNQFVNCDIALQSHYEPVDYRTGLAVFGRLNSLIRSPFKSTEVVFGMKSREANY